MKSKGEKAYERYMTALATKIKYNTMPRWADVPAIAQAGFEAAADSTAAVHDEYKVVATVTEPVVEPVVNNDSTSA